MNTSTQKAQLASGTQHQLVRFKFWANGNACGIKVKTTGEVLAENEHDAFEVSLKFLQDKFPGYIEKASPGVTAYPSIKRIKSNPGCLGTGHLVAGTQHNIVGRPDDLTKQQAKRPEREDQ